MADLVQPSVANHTARNNYYRRGIQFSATPIAGLLKSLDAFFSRDFSSGKFSEQKVKNRKFKNYY